MYLVGNDADAKASASALIQGLIAESERLVTDVEVFLEILHRYRAINRLEAIQECFDVLNEIVDEVFGLDPEDVESAKSVLLSYPRLSARDALHIAVMQKRQVTRIASFDQEFDLIPGIERLGGQA